MELPTQEQIVARVRERQDIDFFGIEIPDYVEYLKFPFAKEFLKPDTKESEWESDELSYDGVVKKIKEYIPFAWEKANDFRGLSARRSILHFIAWSWLSGDFEFAKEIQKEFETNFRFYGKDILVKVCNHYGIDPKLYDDSVRENYEVD